MDNAATPVRGHLISRVNKVPVIGPWLWRTYDRLQAISPHYPFRDLSKPSLGSMRLDRLMSKGFGGSVVEHTRKREDLPLLTTFFAVALAADRLGRKDVFCVVTDTDVNRIWAAKVPANGRIHHLAPTPLTRQRLMQYGVLPERIHFTGFPLPLENVATAAEDLRRRIPVLDVRGAFRRGLTDWLNNGLLALNAFQGYFHMPRMGTENIKRLLFAPDRSQVAMDLGAVLPERA
jgi:hypothetical protein